MTYNGFNKKIIAAPDLGRNTVIKHQIQPEYAVLPGCNIWKACIRRGGSLRNEKKRYVAITLEQQQQLCTGASRQPDGPWSHGDVT